MTRFWPRFSVYSRVDAVSEERLWEVTRSVSLLARGSPIGLLITETVSTAAPPLSARVRRLSGLRVCRRWGLRLLGAARCSRVPTARLGGLWERVLGGRTAVARDGRMSVSGEETATRSKKSWREAQEVLLTVDVMTHSADFDLLTHLKLSCFNSES